MTGKKLDKGAKSWENYKLLRSIRDDENIHAKNLAYGFTLETLAVRINLFKTGVAGMLIQLHLLFGMRIPTSIIRARFHRDVELAEEN